MFSNIVLFLPYFVLVSHIVFVFLVLAIIFRNSWGAPIHTFLGKRAILLSFLVSLVAVFGSLFYSEIMGFEPCVLCWWQRIFLYPLLVIFGIALWKKVDSAFLYAVPLALLASLVAILHSYGSLGGQTLLLPPCLAVGGDCAKVYVLEFGYITIPMMSLTIALFILLLAWSRRLYENSNPQR